MTSTKRAGAVVTCCECEKPVAWYRHTQFAGSHPFCATHARSESDFRTRSSYLFWERVTPKSSKKSPQPNR